jgi:hypothetical protein
MDYLQASGMADRPLDTKCYYFRPKCKQKDTCSTREFHLYQDLRLLMPENICQQMHYLTLVSVVKIKPTTGVEVGYRRMQRMIIEDLTPF